MPAPKGMTRRCNAASEWAAQTALGKHCSVTFFVSFDKGETEACQYSATEYTSVLHGAAQCFTIAVRAVRAVRALCAVCDVSAMRAVRM